MSRSYVNGNAQLFSKYLVELRQGKTNLAYFDWKIENGFARREEYLII